MTIHKIEKIDNIALLDEKVKKLLEDTESKMSTLIDDYNVSVEDKEDEPEVNDVDLFSKFDDLKDYVSDYTQ